MMRSTSILILLTASSCTKPSASPHYRHPSGERIWVQTDQGEVRVRTERNAAGTVWRTDDGRTLPSSSVRAFTIKRRGQGARQGAGIGLLIGVTLGVIMSSLPSRDDCKSDGYYNFCDPGWAFWPMAAGLTGVLDGCVIGLVRGSRDVYELDDGPARLRVSASPVSGGGAAQLSWSF